jgi:YlmC/YmxH family sporulation protein
MLFSEFKKKEVINMRDCRKLGHVVDMDFDECSGCIRRITVSDNICCKCFGCSSLLCREPDYIICFHEIKQIGPDIIVVDIG